VADHFLDAAGEHFVCATHGALFRIGDGHCVSGPCQGDALQRLAAVREDADVLIALPASPRPDTSS
jgi:nitrite reductase/ring-hydroxylating ferredoxin subunit